VDYESWPENGCTLAEARERVADRLPRFETPDGVHVHSPNQNAIRQPENIEADFLSHMTNRRLMAYGRSDHLEAPRRLITSHIWSTLSKIDWERSSAEQDQPGGVAFFELRIFPILLAPCRADLIAGYSLSEAFKKFQERNNLISRIRARIGSGPLLRAWRG